MYLPIGIQRYKQSLSKKLWNVQSKCNYSIENVFPIENYAKQPLNYTFCPHLNDILFNDCISFEKKIT